MIGWFWFLIRILRQKLLRERPIAFQQQNLADLCNEFKDYLLFYTDGSKSQDGESAGFASIYPLKQLAHSWKINNAASIFSIEAIAILHTLDYISKQDF